MRDRLAELWHRLRGSEGGDAEAEMDEELRFHMEMATRRNAERGMTPEAARREALLQFGGEDRHREAVRDVQRVRWLEDFRQDALHALRLLRRSPGFSLAALLTLALGVGANTAIFSVLDAVLLRPLPYHDASELISFEPGRYGSYREAVAAAQSLATSGAYTYSIATVTGGAEPARVWTLAVTSSLLPTLGVAPLYGRSFTVEDDAPNAPARVMLRHAFWQAQYGGDPGIVGRTIEVLGHPHEVIGILGPELEFPPPARRSDGSMPITAEIWTSVGWLSDLYERGGFHAIGRLAPGWTLEAASAELEAVASGSAGGGAQPARLLVRGVGESVVAPLRPAVLAFAAGIGLLLLVACANLGNMLLARLSSRSRELAVRASLGAPRGRIVRQIAAEGAVLAAGGCIAAIGIAWLMLRALLALAPAELARIHGAGLNPRVLAVTLALGSVTALLISVLPAWIALGRDPHGALGSTRGASGDRNSSGIQRALVACEVALAVVLLVGGGLLLRSFAALASVSPGFDVNGLVTADVLLPPDRYPSRADVLRFFERLEERLGATPGVRSVSGIDRLPYGPSYSGISFRIVGRDVPPEDREPRGSNTAARPDYFATMGIPMLKGREFSATDIPESPPVVIISNALAERYWAGVSPIGERIVAFGVEREIIGVAGDVRHSGPMTPVDPLLYLPQSQDIATRRMITIVARTDAAAPTLIAAVRTHVHALDPQLPISNLRTFGTLRSERTAGQRFNALLMASFATLGLLLAAVGIYGVMSFVVAQRTREIGVRMALGASRMSVLAVFIRQAMQSVGLGAVAGLAIAIPLTSLLRSMLFGISATDAVTYVGVVLLVAAISLVAAWAPARRASRVEPYVALIGD